MRTFTLRFWILFLVSLTIFLTFSGTLITAYVVTHKKLEEKALLMHEAYAKKFANTTELIFKLMQGYLKAKSSEIATRIDNPDQLKEIFASTEFNPFFNSLVLTNSSGIITATYPELGVTGRKTSIDDVKYNLRRSLITTPYRALTGRLIVTLAEPIYDANGMYRGNIAGTIYLEENNFLTDIVKDHFFSDESYAWVMDKEGHVVFHPNKSRIGEDVTKNQIVQKLIKGESGYDRATNTQGVEMLVGFATVPSSGWGVGSQTPVSAVDVPAIEVIQRMLLYTTPIVLLVLLLSWLITNNLVVPLKKLALYSKSISKEHMDKESLGSIPTWYFESEQLKRAVQLYTASLEKEVNHFKKEALTDELTGLANRRHIEEILLSWTEQEKPFSIVLIDIDHFKKVNDLHGHQTGDEVLKSLARLMEDQIRNDDLCGRYGGEEFIILFPNTEQHIAMNVVDRIHLLLCSKPIYKDLFITISAGVGHYPELTNDLKTLIALTDNALYQAKHEGRNRTVKA